MLLILNKLHIITDRPIAMPFIHPHPEDPHYINRSGWLRAAVLGANDGIVSISSLLMGVASATPNNSATLIAGIAGLSAGAMSMAAGEYVSVSSQSDIERADIKREKKSLRKNPELELKELIEIYKERGLSQETAKTVAQELTNHDALSTHIRDELGIFEVHQANPLHAAIASGLTFSVAGAIPLLGALLAPAGHIILTTLIVTLLSLVALGITTAKAGGAAVLPATLRVLFWGTFAMGVTASIGLLFNARV